MVTPDEPDNIAVTNRPHPTRDKAWHPAFLEMLASTCNVRAACEAAKVHRSTAYEQRGNDPDFKRAWDVAVETALDVLELVAFHGAQSGDRDLLKFYLRNRRASVWNKAADLSFGGNGEPIDIHVRFMENANGDDDDEPADPPAE